LIYNSDGELLYANEADGDFVSLICETIFEFGGREVYYSSGKDMRFAVSHKDEYSELGAYHAAKQLKLADVTSIENLTYMGTYFPSNEACMDFATIMSKRFANKFIANPHGTWCDVVAFGVSKETGIMKYLELTNSAPNKIVTAGDNFNDIPMLVTHYGYAMTNAPIPVIKAAGGRTADRVGDVINTEM